MVKLIFNPRMSVFPTGVVTVAIALSGLLLHNRAEGFLKPGDPNPPFEYAFECMGSSTPAEAAFNRIKNRNDAHCTDADIARINTGDPLSVKHHFHYKCSTRYTVSGPSSLSCVPDRDCVGCMAPYSEAMCQYDSFSLSRLWANCTTLRDEITRMETIETVDDADPEFGEDLTTIPIPVTTLPPDYIPQPDYDHNPKPHISGKPYCDDGKPSMVIHPCFVPPLMVVVDKKDCLQKVTCGTRPEENEPFKVNLRAPPVRVNVGSWSGEYYDAWSVLPAHPKYVLNKAINKLTNCTSVTGFDNDQCGRCKAEKEVARLYRDGYTVVLAW
ncbi:uncharacterized protein LOC129581299 [Paramacrobiotus metropolitanus]|uniref:uncharacterized protein LOC129581299 n=1 Tax=Paramacrobiotus metropolitanus TaxID=2943436 RepID=UPI002446344B|nr:uncharacterized protein LOC129581299 [Paramacrobiotus metropolitanus]